MAEEYLSARAELRLFIQLVDARHQPTPLDRALYEWLAFHEKPSLIVATKADKLSKNQLTKNLREIEASLPATRVIPYSSETGKGRDAVWSEIEKSLKTET